MHVELADATNHAESWGVTLAYIARTIAHDHASYHLTTSREDQDVLAAIVDGFTHALRKLDEHSAAPAAEEGAAQCEQDETPYGKFRELPAPDTFPKDGSCYAAELMRVVQVLDGKAGTPLGYHIELEHTDFWPDAWQDEWGGHLANLAWKIANDYSEGGFYGHPPKSFAKICASFVQTVSALNPQQLEQAMQPSKAEAAQ